MTFLLYIYFCLNFCFIFIKTYFDLFSAEFIIDLADKSGTFETFKRLLIENGAEFSVSLHLLLSDFISQYFSDL